MRPLTRQRSLSSGEVTGPKAAVGVQLENPAVAVVVLEIIPNRQAGRALAEAVAALVVLVALSVPMVKEAHALGHLNDRVAKAGITRKKSERNHLTQKVSAIEEGGIVARAISDSILRSSGRVVSQRLIFCPIATMSAQADLSYFW